MSQADPSEITPEHLYLSRRKFISGVSALVLGSVALGACAPPEDRSEPETWGSVDAAPSPSAEGGSTPAAPTPTPTEQADELGDATTPYKDIANYTNYYEFSLDKEEPTRLSQGFSVSPWEVEVGGLVNNPRTFGLEDLREMFDQEDRIYRMRCVEAWSMVIPWRGFPLAALLQEVEPASQAKYVRFETIYDPERMPGQKNPSFPWPYVEGLRLDEAMHDLTLLATGLYGKDLEPQNGAPVRLVVPWKYGFKSIKSIVKIDLVEEMPVSLWMASSPNEYGFFANVNPDVSHPRWSQSTERRIGETGRRKTLLFNGYEEEVAHLYEGMDLGENF
jgi:sulfoxide reductase catalytic subunit YedY